MIIKIILFILFVVVIYELALSYTRYIRRKRIYALAKTKSQLVKKPLLVIGDPNNGSTNYLIGSSYGCGDVCLDLTGCPECPNGVKQKIEAYLPELENNSYVIFISCVLEYVDTQNLDFIHRELMRVSGGDLFIVSVEPLSLTAILYPTRFVTGERGPNQIILSEYPDTNLKYYPLSLNSRNPK
jgi:hypothetical protein